MHNHKDWVQDYLGGVKLNSESALPSDNWTSRLIISYPSLSSPPLAILTLTSPLPYNRHILLYLPSPKLPSICQVTHHYRILPNPILACSTQLLSTLLYHNSLPISLQYHRLSYTTLHSPTYPRSIYPRYPSPTHSTLT